MQLGRLKKEVRKFRMYNFINSYFLYELNQFYFIVIFFKNFYYR
jgi:hypothetical protein